jgi:hypothetical protein
MPANGILPWHMVTLPKKLPNRQHHILDERVSTVSLVDESGTGAVVQFRVSAILGLGKRTCRASETADLPDQVIQFNVEKGILHTDLPVRFVSAEEIVSLRNTF